MALTANSLYYNGYDCLACASGGREGRGTGRAAWGPFDGSHGRRSPLGASGAHGSRERRRETGGTQRIDGALGAFPSAARRVRFVAGEGAVRWRARGRERTGWVRRGARHRGGTGGAFGGPPVGTGGRGSRPFVGMRCGVGALGMVRFVGARAGDVRLTLAQVFLPSSSFGHPMTLVSALNKKKGKSEYAEVQSVKRFRITPMSYFKPYTASPKRYLKRITAAL